MLPPDPIGTFASHDGANGHGFGGLDAALGYADEGMKCTHPIGNAGPDGGTLCAYIGPVFLYETYDYWGGGEIADIWRRYSWRYKALDAQGNCTQEMGGNDFGISTGTSLNCPPGMTKSNTADGKSYLCIRPRLCWRCLIGDPILVGAGEMTQAESDFTGAGPFPLRIGRYYGSQSTAPSLGEPRNVVPPFGVGWRTEYQRNVNVFTAAAVPIITLRRETGEARNFTLSSTGAVVPLPGERGYLQRLVDGSGTLTGWTYTTPEEDVEAYDAEGKLLSITNRSGLAHTLAYDVNGRLDSVTDSFGRQLVYHYSSDGHVDTVTIPGGLTYAYAYNAAGALTGVAYPDNTTTRTYVYEEPRLPFGLTGIVDEKGVRFATFSYNLNNGFAATAEHAGGVYKYSVSGGLSMPVTDPLGTQRSYQFGAKTSARTNVLQAFYKPGVGGVAYTNQLYSYDNNGNISQYTDDKNNVTTYTFDLTRNVELKRVEASGTPQARTISTQWHVTRRLPKAVAEPLKITSYAYNGETGVTCAPTGASTALLCSKTIQATSDATGAAAFAATADGTPRTWSYTYDANGELLTVDGSRTDVADVTTFTYDVGGSLASITDALGHVTQFTDYDPAGRLLRSTDPNGLETLLDYNERGWLRHRRVGRAADGYELTTYDYEPTGSLSKVTLPDGSYVAYTYDDAHRLIKLQDGLGNRIEYTLDGIGNRVGESAYDIEGTLVRAHSRVMDILNRISKEIGGTSPSTQITGLTYDANDNATGVTDPLGRTTTKIYDALNRVIQVNDPFNGSGSPTKYQYNGQDQLTKVTDPTGLSTTYTINGHGELTSQSSPETGATSFSYDASSNVKSKTDARGVTATYDYDGLNRPTQITYPDETVTYAYDTCTNGIGRLCSISDKTGTTLYSYDFHGRVTNKLQVVDTISQSMTYEYNAAGQLGSITLPSGHKVVYTYDNNRPVSVAVDGQLVLDSVFYEPFGPNGGWRWGNSQAGAVNTHTRVFDQDFRATRVTSDLPSTGPQPYFDLQYGWDVQSRIQAITDASARVPSATYGYDALDRLNSVSQGTTSLGFTYDGIGGRETSVLNGASTTYTYVAGTHRLQSLSGSQSRAFGYDAAGNMISDGGSTWTYGANNRPTQAGMMDVSINALGQRVKRTASGTTQRFVYDESGRLWGEYDDQGAPIAETVWLGDLPVAVLR